MKAMCCRKNKNIHRVFITIHHLCTKYQRKRMHAAMGQKKNSASSGKIDTGRKSFFRSESNKQETKVAEGAGHCSWLRGTSSKQN